ncbi:MAG: hypothetical protein J6S23_08110 [Clostridia bacterium]|nr:hypothetical protein [Clostridia bacterium]
MKNSYRRLLSFALVLVLILSTAAVLSGCYVTRSAKMKFVEGTYELTSYSGDSNWLEERGIKLIMVIRSDGTGYYGYKDNTTDGFISELRCRFTQDTEDSSKYQYVEVDFTGNGEYHQLGINADWRTQKLGSSTAKWKGNLFQGTAEIDYYISVGFTRISKKTDRSVLDEHFPGEHQTVVYGMQKYQGTYEFERCDGGIYPDVVGYVPPSPFVYFYLNIDFYDGTGKAYYMLTKDEVAKEVEISVKAIKNDDGTFSVHVGEVVGKLLEENFSRYIHLPRTNPEYMKLRYVGDMSHESIVVHCENAYAVYLAGLDVSQ